MDISPKPPPIPPIPFDLPPWFESQVRRRVKGSLLTFLGEPLALEMKADTPEKAPLPPTHGPLH
jgi:hypothetical protein